MEALLTIASFVLQYVLRVFALGRFHRSRVVFFSYFGTQYSCNPKYLSEHLERHCPEVEIAWAFTEPERHKELEGRGITLVRYNTPAFLHLCLTSRYVVTNSELPSWFPYLSRQTIINTWHGGGAYKRVGADFHKGSRWRDLRSAIARRKPCVYLSSSAAFTQLTIRESFEHTGTVIDSGMPRNDILVNQDRPVLPDKVKDALGVPQDSHVLLYAPTYREDREASSYLFDFQQVVAALERRFGGSWTIALRMHYFVMNQLPPSRDYVDASSYPDMQELLYAADVLVTDYSSSIWDFGLTGKPCFLYATDLSSYDKERGFYSDIRTWPWELAERSDQLSQAILSFDEERHAQRLAEHYQQLGSYERGLACELVGEYLLQNL